MSYTSENISYRDVEVELQKNILPGNQFKKKNGHFKALYCIKGIYKEDLYVIFKKISYAHRRDPYEYRAQASDLSLSKYLEINNIKNKHFILVGFFKITGNTELTLSIFNSIGNSAKNRSYYLDETSGTFSIPFGPVTSITSIHADGIALTHTNVGLDKETIELDNGYAKKVTVIYITSGLNDSLLQQAILQLATTYYENRVDFNSGDENKASDLIPSDTRDILNSYKAMFL